MANHHGTMNFMLHGIDSMCHEDQIETGRFGRIFRLSPLEIPEEDLRRLGKAGGPMDGGMKSNPSSTIPLGMVFLGQFIDHDITLDVTSRLDRVNDPFAINNFRTPNLDLDCIYGRGPEASNYLFKKHKPFLLMGSDGTGLKDQDPDLSQNDLVRTSEGVAIIGDPRNDENRVISQLQLAFIRFHNEVVSYLLELHGDDIEDLYEVASQVVRWHYQWIIIHEFLPLMVGQTVVDQIIQERKVFNPPKTFIPIEFAAAAYRFGHSVAPHQLKVQPNQKEAFDLFGPALGRGFTPITDKQQIVDWSLLFDIDPSKPAQRAERLDTKLASGLLALPFLPPEENSLATRNLIRGQSFLLPSGESVAGALGISEAEQYSVSAFIDSVGNTYGINFSKGTPLWFYILAEAEVLGKMTQHGRIPGEGLGPVGATIVGETLIGLLQLDQTSVLHQKDWNPLFGKSNSFTMADLLTFSSEKVI